MNVWSVSVSVNVIVSSSESTSMSVRVGVCEWNTIPCAGFRLCDILKV